MTSAQQRVLQRIRARLDTLTTLEKYQLVAELRDMAKALMVLAGQLDD